MNMHIKQVLRSVLICGALSVLLTGELRAKELNLLQVPMHGQSDSAHDSLLQRRPDDPAHFNRRGRVILPPHLLAMVRELTVGDVLRLNVFSGKPFSIVVRSIEETRFGGSVITGAIEGTEDQTFVMSINEEDFVISLQDLSKGNTYYLSGKTATGAGEAVEVDDRKRPGRTR